MNLRRCDGTKEKILSAAYIDMTVEAVIREFSLEVPKKRGELPVKESPKAQIIARPGNPLDLCLIFPLFFSIAIFAFIASTKQ